jgi:hypothetical protein
MGLGVKAKLHRVRDGNYLHHTFIGEFLHSLANRCFAKAHRLPISA